MVCNINGPMDDLSVTLLGMFQRGRFRSRVWGEMEVGEGVAVEGGCGVGE